MLEPCRFKWHKRNYIHVNFGSSSRNVITILHVWKSVLKEIKSIQCSSKGFQFGPIENDRMDE